MPNSGCKCIVILDPPDDMGRQRLYVPLWYFKKNKVVPESILEGDYRASSGLKSEGTVMTERERLIERIKKLLALAESSNPNEAENAMLQAQRLMAEHGIRQNEVAGSVEKRARI